MADKRPYTKRNPEYWQTRHNRPVPAPQPVIVQTTAAAPTVSPEHVRPFPEIVYGSTQLNAIASSSAPQSLTRGPGVNSGMVDSDAFANIRAIPTPYGGFDGNRDGGGYVGCSDAINLCVRAWTAFAPVTNAIESAVEFSSQPLFVKSTNDTVKTFFTEWLRAINIGDLKEHYFREYYRSGNVFLYRFDGKFGPAYYGNFHSSFGAKENRVPIRYELLNPANVFVPSGLSYPYTYVRLLSTWECERLRTPLTEQDRQVFNDLPPEAKSQIKNGASNPQGIYLQMEPSRLRFSFYKKQPYDPMAVPFVWRVLPSLEWKLGLTKMDKRLARTIEHAILIVTNGEAPNQYNGGNGINQNNIARLQSLFSNPTINRVLVADYTTKAEWLIPDIQEILGPEKYQVVNEDIREALQSILGDGDKFANAMIKAQVFIQRLEEGQRKFLDDFLLPEVKAICDTMGFRTVPEVGFMKINLQDKTVFQRIITQLAQIGILTAPQAVEAIETGVMPDSHEMERGQEEYRKQREKGLYEPLIGGQKKEDGAGANGRPAGTGKTPQSVTRKSSPIGTSKAGVEAAGASEAFSMKTYGECLLQSQALASEVEKALRKRYKVKGPLTEAQAGVAHSLVKAIITTEPRDKWASAVASVVAKPPVVPGKVSDELVDISTEYGVDDFDAALLRHCRTEAPAQVAA